MAKLIYFNGRGRAEIIRLLLAATDIEFTEEFLEQKDDIEKLRNDGKLTFHQVPMLEIDGLQLVQTGAIVRYIARKAGIYGSSNEEATMIDMYFEGSRDFQNLFLPIHFLNPEEVLKTAKDRSMSRYLPVLNKRLEDNKTGFLVGSELSLADIGILEPLLNAVEYFGIEVLKDFEELKKFYESFVKLKRISSFLNGPQRKRPNDEKYVSMVKRVLYS